MAMPTCVKCGSTIFVLQPHPSGKDRKIDVFYCSRCGTVAGITGSREWMDKVDLSYSGLGRLA
jgi:hypothetical protein